MPIIERRFQTKQWRVEFLTIAIARGEPPAPSPTAIFFAEGPACESGGRGVGTYLSTSVHGG